MKKFCNSDTCLDTATTRKIDPSNGAFYVDILTAKVGDYEYDSGNLKKTSEELFAQESLDSYKDKDVVWGGHCKTSKDGLVNSENYAKENICGHVVSAVQDGHYVRARACIKDKAVIDYIENNEIHASPGFFHNVVDNKQTDIRINHLAIFSPNAATARGGSGCRALDTQPEDLNMDLKNKANDAQQKIDALLETKANLTVELKTANDAVSEKDAEIDVLKKENQELKDKMSLVETNALKLSCDGFLKDSALLNDCKNVDEVKISVLTENKFMDGEINFTSVDSTELNAYFNCFKNSHKKQISNDSINNANQILGKSNNNNKSSLELAYEQNHTNKGDK